MTATTEELAAASARPAERLADRVRLLTTGGSRRRPDRWMLVVGGLLAPLGVLLVFLGWLGASRTPLLFEQIPYLISGGQLGVALVIGGGFVYFTYWQSLRVREARTQHAELIAALARLEETLQAPAPARRAPRG